jgi:phosphonate transport system substrate-binding protein
MNRRAATRLIATSIATSLASAWSLPAQAAGAPIRIGLTPVILADQAAFLNRWAAYLGERVGTPVVFVARDEYQPILDLLFSGQLDAAWICGYPYVRQQRQLNLLAVPVYRGQPTYQAYLIRPTKSPIAGWRDLRGFVLAYSDRLSNSGWLVAQGELKAAGVLPSDLRRAFFAHGHRNVAEAVAARLADAGSIDGYVWDTMRQQKMAAALQTEVVWRSPPHGFPPIVAPAGRVHPMLAALQQVLRSMPADENGRSLLAALNLDGFVEGAPALYDSIRRLALNLADSGVSA